MGIVSQQNWKLKSSLRCKQFVTVEKKIVNWIDPVFEYFNNKILSIIFVSRLSLGP